MMNSKLDMSQLCQSVSDTKPPVVAEHAVRV